MRSLITVPRAERRGRSDSLARSPRGASRGFQIGPRIRVGGTLGKIGQKAKIGLGKLEKTIAPAAMFIPGFGPALAAGLEASGNVLDTSNGGLHMNNLPGVALKTAGMYAGGKLAGALEGKLAGSTLGKPMLGSVGLGNKVPIGDAGYGGMSSLSSAIPQSALEGVMQPQAGGADSEDPAWLHVAKGIYGGVKHAGTGGAGSNTSGLDKLLLGASVVDRAIERNKINGLYHKGEQYAEDSYNQRAPLRNTSLSVLEHSFTNSPNPYTQRYLSTKTPVGG